MFNTISTGKAIAELRKQKNMTQMELADRMGVSYQAVSNWERGNSMPDISKLEDLSRALDVTIDQLLGNEASIRLAKHFIAGDEKEYIREEKVGLEDLEEIAPLLKPEQVGDAFKAFADRPDKPVTLSALAGLAPFLGKEYLDRFIQDIEVGSIRELAGIAPFLSRESISTLAGRAIEAADLDALGSIAPFVSKSALDDLVSRSPDMKVNLAALSRLAPFLSKETLGKLALQAMESGSARDIGRLAPFLPKEVLHQLADRILKEGGVSWLHKISPCL
ncbi:MAG: helix-turn-helix transcriptional regulator [Clostridiaceae bacterium]|nr:helix-turn-helix transcriptional regulator [Clostridiaceae bacterium]